MILDKKELKIQFASLDIKVKRNLMIESRKLTLISLLAAVYALGSYLPGFPLLGLPGSRIDVTRSLEMGYGFILGPVYGPITALIGAIVGKVITGGGFGIYFTPLAPLTALIAASLGRERIFMVKGWIISASIIILLLLAWYITPVGRAIPYYPILHFNGLLIILLLREKLADFINSEDKKLLSLGVALASYSSTIGGHMLGNLIFISLVDVSPAFFVSILPIALGERLFLTLLSTGIMTPLIIVIRDTFPGLIETESHGEGKNQDDFNQFNQKKAILSIDGNPLCTHLALKSLQENM
jgi:hypothetical protein